MSSSLIGARKIGRLAAVLAVVLAVTLIPVTTVTVPAWEVQVVDESGRSVNGACVYQSWLQYSFEPGVGHNDEAKADATGRVKFPERTAAATVLRRIVGPLSQLGKLHPSFGAHAWIIAGAPDQQGMVRYDSRKGLPAKIVLHPDKYRFEWEEGSTAKRCSPIPSHD